jgi:hypothetical protein
MPEIVHLGKVNDGHQDTGKRKRISMLITNLVGIGICLGREPGQKQKSKNKNQDIAFHLYSL